MHMECFLYLFDIQMYEITHRSWQGNGAELHNFEHERFAKPKAMI
jgi:hypothetical protein